MKKKMFVFEVYMKNPITKEEGWNIDFPIVFAEDYNEAKEILKTIPDFDCIILFDHCRDINEYYMEFYANGANYILNNDSPIITEGKKQNAKF